MFWVPPASFFKYTKIVGGRGSAPDPAGEEQAPPRPHPSAPRFSRLRRLTVPPQPSTSSAAYASRLLCCNCLWSYTVLYCVSINGSRSVIASCLHVVIDVWAWWSRSMWWEGGKSRRRPQPTDDINRSPLQINQINSSLSYRAVCHHIQQTLITPFGMYEAPLQDYQAYQYKMDTVSDCLPRSRAKRFTSIPSPF